MESFYGGQQGFSFVVKRNPAEGHDGYFYNVNEINKAARDGVLRYGDYAIVTNTINNYTREHGDLYRINTRRMAEKVANISHPALATLISEIGEFDNRATGIHTTSINFLTENESKTQETLDISWKNVPDPQDSSKVIGIEIGIKAPRPVIDISVSQKELNDENPFEIASNAGIVTKENNKPFYYEYGIELPMRSILVPEKTEIETSNLDSGTLCFMTSDIIGKWNNRSGQLKTIVQAQSYLIDFGGSGDGRHYGAAFMIGFQVDAFSKMKVTKLNNEQGKWHFYYKILQDEEETSSEIPILPKDEGTSIAGWTGGSFNTVCELQKVSNKRNILYFLFAVEGNHFTEYKEELKNFSFYVMR